MTVNEMRDAINDAIAEGHGDREFAVAADVKGHDGRPLVYVYSLAAVTRVYGMNVPSPDWPVCAWIDEYQVFDFSGDEPKEVTCQYKS